MSEAAVMEFVGKAVGDVGALLNGSMVVLGDRLGLYRAMAGAGPITPAELATKTGTHERYVREWLSAQAAAGYVTYDGAGSFELPPEQAIALTDESSPACVIGAFELALASVHSTDRLTHAFRTGEGVSWGDHHTDLYEGCERFFRPGYQANLIDGWLPLLDGVVDKLRAGAVVADVGCGHGASTLVMAEAFPASRFVGFDAHAGSIEVARKRAAEQGVSDRVSFETATAKDFIGRYDLICLFDCLHDMGDPVGACAHVRSRLDGTARCCSSNRSPASTWGRTSIPSVPPTTGSRRCSAPRDRCRRRWARRSARRPESLPCGGSPPRAASPASGAWPRRRSTSCSRSGRS
jgi:SAM-dependent methyltransferase